MTQLNKQLNSRPDSSWRLSLPDLKAHLIFWLVFICGLFLDLYSKKIIFNWLQDTGSFSIIKGFLSLIMAENTGAAFGIAAGRRLLLIATSIIALAGVIAIFIFGHVRQRLVQVALALFAAGVAGNLYDRIFNDGRVRDFIDVVYWPGVHWPAFNLADSMLCISVALLIISTLRPHYKDVT
jgi:signal peptidase II